MNKFFDKISEIIIYFMIIFTPWAFGTTENWAISTMTCSSFLLSMTCLFKYLSRFIIAKETQNSFNTKRNTPTSYRIINIVKFCLIAFFISYILINAVNSKGEFNILTKEYYYNPHVSFLPHSYDKNSTLRTFYQCIGLILFYYSFRSWIIDQKNNTIIQSKLNKIVWLICVNGSALATVSILQRIYYGDAPGYLLFLVKPFINDANLLQFGPFAYRANAASYFNMIWPIGIGFFIHNILYNNKKMGEEKEILMIPLIFPILASPIFTSSLSGAAIFLFILFISLLVYLRAAKKIQTKLHIFFIISSLILVSIIIFSAWDQIDSRLINLFNDHISHRIIIYKKTISMIKEYGIYGTGPGTFEFVYQFELNNPDETWHSWAHNDYLEYLLTFGIIGCLPIIMLLIIYTIQLLIKIFYKKISIFEFYCLLAIVGILIHSLIDFPLQVYSLLFTFVLIIALIKPCYK